jgi:hypothetical protein
MMAGMAKRPRNEDTDPMEEIKKAAALYEQYVELSGVASIATVSKEPDHSVSAPALMTIICC